MEQKNLNFLHKENDFKNFVLMINYQTCKNSRVEQFDCGIENQAHIIGQHGISHKIK